MRGIIALICWGMWAGLTPRSETGVGMASSPSQERSTPMGTERHASAAQVTLHADEVSVMEALRRVASSCNLCLVQCEGIVYLVHPDRVDDFMAQQEGWEVAVYAIENIGPPRREELVSAFGSVPSGDRRQ